MTQAKSYQSDLKAAIHQTASDLYEVGLLATYQFLITEQTR